MNLANFFYLRVLNEYSNYNIFKTMLIIILVIFALNNGNVLANFEGECVDKTAIYDRPIKLWNSTIGAGIKLGSSYQTSCCTGWYSVVTTNESEALTVYWRTSKQMVLTSDTYIIATWPNKRNGIMRWLKNNTVGGTLSGNNQMTTIWNDGTFTSYHIGTYTGSIN